MKRTLITILIVAVVLILMITMCIVLFKRNSDETEVSKVTLNVNGNVIKHKDITIYSEYANLPFTEVLKGLGYDVVWIDKNIAHVNVGKEKYILKLSGEVSFNKENDSFNCVMPAPGCTNYHCEVIDNELILDSNTIRVVSVLIGQPVDVNIDYDNNVVYITTRNNS